jgi:hypothetical protein
LLQFLHAVAAGDVLLLHANLNVHNIDPTAGKSDPNTFQK